MRLEPTVKKQNIAEITPGPARVHYSYMNRGNSKLNRKLNSKTHMSNGKKITA